ncbi:MAG: mandelate racemase/muconate lactonizing enzyme family protein [Geminicoccaceae bacterium]|nr:mandelate racemase/muconate lactonizing enzyme family protein [Geminicoccaceae bacterium]
MRIEKIELTHHRLPLDPAFPASWDPEPRRSFTATIVRVWAEGVCGVGSGDAMPGFSGHEGLFVGQDPRDMGRHARIIDNLSFHYGRCWPLDLALWDLLGKLLGQPVWRLLGGRQPVLPLYASTGVRRGPEATAEVCTALKGRGFRAIKVRFQDEDPRRDLARVQAARDAVGPDVGLMVDANQGWRMPWDDRPSWTLKDALFVADALEEVGAFWLEEPLHRADVAGLAALRARTPLRVAGGELARETHDVDRYIDARALDVLQPDAVMVGGISLLRDAARRAQDAGILFTPHTWGNGVGLMANAQLMGGVGGCPCLEFPLDPPEWDLPARDFVLARPIVADGNGCLALSETPGLGLDLDEAALARTRI